MELWKNPQTHIQLWAQDVTRLPVGPIPSELGLHEMKCGTQMPVAPPSLQDPHATLPNQRK